MFKNSYYLLFLFLLAPTFYANAQTTDTVKHILTIHQVDSLKKADSLRRVDSLVRIDTVKLDTIVLNRYRINPHRNPLPVIVQPIEIDPNLVPISLLDYKVSYWRKWVTVGFNLNQSAFSSNWSGGGTNSLALGGNFDFKTEYNKSPFDYTSELITQYGRTSNSGHLSRKTNDRLFLDNKIATQLSKHWYFFGSLDFESQFDKGYQYDDTGTLPNYPMLISGFMSPGYITESLGFEYKPNKAFDLRLGTGTARQTIVLNDTLYKNVPTNYGVTPGHTFLNELAFQIVAAYDKDIMPNLHLNTCYQMFIPYGRSLENIDHRLDLTLAAKVNRLINVTITATGLYDKDTSEKLQGTEALAIGILYKFP